MSQNFVPEDKVSNCTFVKDTEEWLTYTNIQNDTRKFFEETILIQTQNLLNAMHKMLSILFVHVSRY